MTQPERLAAAMPRAPVRPEARKPCQSRRHTRLPPLSREHPSPSFFFLCVARVCVSLAAPPRRNAEGDNRRRGTGEEEEEVIIAKSSESHKHVHTDTQIPRTNTKMHAARRPSGQTRGGTEPVGRSRKRWVRGGGGGGAGCALRRSEVPARTRPYAEDKEKEQHTKANTRERGGARAAR